MLPRALPRAHALALPAQLPAAVTLPLPLAVAVLLALAGRGCCLELGPTAGAHPDPTPVWPARFSASFTETTWYAGGVQETAGSVAYDWALRAQVIARQSRPGKKSGTPTASQGFERGAIEVRIVQLAEGRDAAGRRPRDSLVASLAAPNSRGG